MTPEELDIRLRTITDHEEGYRKGQSNPEDRTFPYIEINGQEVMQFSYAKISAQYNAIPFLVRKHSRFREYPFHIHDWIEISYMYSGTCVQIIEGKEYQMKTGQLLLMAPNTIHTIKPLSENDILVQITLGQKNLTGNFFNRLSSSSIVSSFFINAFNASSNKDQFFLFESQNDRRLRLFIEEFLCEWYDPSLSTLDILNSLFSLIASELVNVMSYNEKEKSHKNSYVPSILRYIEANYTNCDLLSAADEFGLNPNYLSNLLKKQTGYSFNELVVQEKLNASRRMLSDSDMSVTDIANYVGYQNMSYFYRIFKDKYGCLPGEYRANNNV